MSFLNIQTALNSQRLVNNSDNLFRVSGRLSQIWQLTNIWRLHHLQSCWESRARLLLWELHSSQQAPHQHLCCCDRSRISSGGRPEKESELHVWLWAECTATSLLLYCCCSPEPKQEVKKASTPSSSLPRCQPVCFVLQGWRFEEPWHSFAAGVGESH